MLCLVPVWGLHSLQINKGGLSPNPTTLHHTVLQACKSLAATKSVGRDAELVLESVLGEGSYGKVSCYLRLFYASMQWAACLG